MNIYVQEKLLFFSVYLSAFNYCFIHAASLLVLGVATSHEQIT